MDKSFLNNNDLPLIKQLDGQSIHFPVAIFQYALGCYDLWLIENNEVYIDKFIQCAEWALNKLDDEGRWDNFHTFIQKLLMEQWHKEKELLFWLERISIRETVNTLKRQKSNRLYAYRPS